MEGIASEAASLAGDLRLGRLIVLYDANRITLSATTNITFSEDVGARFAAFGWQVQEVDGMDVAAVDAALTAARADEHRPSLIVARTHIGFGSPNKHDTFEAHGEPLGANEVRLTKRAYGWPEDAKFLRPRGGTAGVRQGRRPRGGVARTPGSRGWTRIAPRRGTSPARWTARDGGRACSGLGRQASRCSRPPMATWPRAMPAGR